MSLFYDVRPIETIDEALSYYNTNDCSSSSRFVVPLLSWLKHEPEMVQRVLHDLKLPAENELHLDYIVAPPGGYGTPSQSDLMVIAGKSSLAMEVKWTEPRFETVGKWLAKGSKPKSRNHLLAGWIGLLQKHAARQLFPSDFSDAVYQMVHVAAAACATGSAPRMAYLVFKNPDEETDYIKEIKEDMMHLRTVLQNPESFPFYLIEVSLSPAYAYNALVSLERGTAGTTCAVVNALRGEECLFDFIKYKCQTI